MLGYILGYQGIIQGTEYHLIISLGIFLLMVLMESFQYGYIFQSKILGLDFGDGIYGGKLSRYLYERFRVNWEYLFKAKKGIPYKYRIIQCITRGLGVIIVGYMCGILSAVGLLLSYYFLSVDFMFYTVMGQLWVARQYEQVRWLSDYVQSGRWMFQPYVFWKFVGSAIIGICLLIISNII
jgi:hypothetical protein